MLIKQPKLIVPFCIKHTYTPISLFYNSLSSSSQKPIVRHNENVVIIRSAAARFASMIDFTVENEFADRAGAIHDSYS